MFRNRIKLVLEIIPSDLISFYGPSAKKLEIELREPIRDVVNVSVKQLIIPPFPASTSRSSILFKSDLSNLSRCINALVNGVSNRNTSDFIMAVAGKNQYPSGGFYYKSDYLDERFQNRQHIYGFWIEFAFDYLTPITLGNFPFNDPEWKITLELEFNIQNEQYKADRL